MHCRHCGNPLTNTLIDLGHSPPSNAYRPIEARLQSETWFPLRVQVCEGCWLVQTEDFVGREAMFSEDYAYFSAFSSSWLEHCERYVEAMQQRFRLDSSSLVCEVAANDGYLLQYVKARSIPCFGIEPTHSTAQAARARGIEIDESFFGTALANRLASAGKRADLMIANNVLAHVPDLNDFVKGFSILLEPNGVVTFEFPHLYNLLTEAQFDTIYHEHYSYLSLVALMSVFPANGLQIFDVERIPTHGGSLRVFAQPASTGRHAVTGAVATVVELERSARLDNIAGYGGLQARALEIKFATLRFLLDAKAAGKSVMGYGAAAKGNTLLNYAGVHSDLLQSVVDLNPQKQNKLLPGSQIPVVDLKTLKTTRPDYIFVLPWNLADEISQQLAFVREWGGRFVRAVPNLQVW